MNLLSAALHGLASIANYNSPTNVNSTSSLSSSVLNVKPSDYAMGSGGKYDAETVAGFREIKYRNYDCKIPIVPESETFWKSAESLAQSFEIEMFNLRISNEVNKSTLIPILKKITRAPSECMENINYIVHEMKCSYPLAFSKAYSKLTQYQKSVVDHLLKMEPKYPYIHEYGGKSPCA
ncbi:hypothetical protein VII00023_13347 [Vibrio ichthyoenteri ATCC 700023]|uniref:Uncharacterized protein n=1 Tax=Vibrio ichthyoenteri ATCC 700023 TaxID=870968 RepID=F9S3Q9_9VIBR|nr:hypothetical protein [Vibrio ichthyoenteri]EGU37803.1 hypothetical protein VII00023_13347 [Vibrio ichthyoenteri ATCC 700023]